MNNDEQILIDSNSIRNHYWSELWRYRDLLFFLSWRDILVRYKQTVIGIAWAIIRPIITMVIFTIVFGYIAKLPSNGTEYSVMVFAAMLPWYFFSSALSEASNSLVANGNMISKIYFPRLIIPASTIAVSLIDLLISLLIMFCLMLWFHITPTIRIIALPFFLLLTIATVFGFGLWFAALNVKYRDFRYVIPFVTQIGLYISPVGFSSTAIPDQWRYLYYANPMTSIIDGFRWSLLGGDFDLYLPGLLISILVILIGLLCGIYFFRRTENTFADMI
jgi:lipopolysaccharide transport system permease protein